MPGGVEVAEVPEPEPAPDEVVVAVDACGLCGSDVHAVALGMVAPGQSLGHEFAGRVVEVGAHAEPLAVALRAVELARVGPGDTALVYGVGPRGLNAIIALRLAGVGRIVGAGRSAGRRAAAAAVGADAVLDTREERLPAYAARTGGRFTAVLECSGTPGALRRLRTPGQLVRMLTRPWDGHTL